MAVMDASLHLGAGLRRMVLLGARLGGWKTSTEGSAWKNAALLILVEALPAWEVFSTD